MKHLRITLFTLFRLLALTAACTILAAHADEYGDVNQLVRAGKLGDALVMADAYLSSKPADPQMRFLKGVIQRGLGKSAEAITTFTKLTEDYPELPEPYNNLAVLYAAQNQYDKARNALELAIRTNPSYATAHENLGDVYARLASQAYNKALQLDGANAVVPPKLALIREIFKPGSKGQTVAPAAPATVAVPPVPTTPAVAAASAPAPKPSASAAVASAKPADTSNAAHDSKAVEAAVRAWASAWSAKDLPAYLGAYGKEFSPPSKLSRSAWEQERRARIAGKSTISVKLENIQLSVTANQAIVKFQQNYRADALAVSSRKTLALVKAGDKWLIVRESTGS